MNHYSVFLATAILLFGTSAHAEIFKWVDANGMTHYSDSVPESQRSQTLNFGELRRPAVPRNQAGHSKMNFPGQPRSVSYRQPVPVQRQQVKRPTSITPKRVKRSASINGRQKIVRPLRAAKTVKRRRTPKATANQPKTTEQPFKEFQLASKLENWQTAISEEKPNLDADVYDIRSQAKKSKKQTLKDLKQKLCNDKRMLLAALQEKGFNSYYDEAGHYRLAWGADGIYQGKRRFLDDKEVAKKTKMVMFEVTQYCENPTDQALQEKARANWIRAEYCTLSKAVLEDLEHPFMRSTDDRIEQQVEKVERLCSKLAPGRFRHDRRYYPTALLAKVVLPRHLMVKEDDAPEKDAEQPQDTLEQLLAVIE